MDALVWTLPFELFLDELELELLVVLAALDEDELVVPDEDEAAAEEDEEAAMLLRIRSESPKTMRRFFIRGLRVGISFLG